MDWSRVCVRRGSVVVFDRGDSNMTIAMSHTPTNNMTIERADFLDLVDAVKAYIERVKDEPSVAYHLKKGRKR